MHVKEAVKDAFGNVKSLRLSRAGGCDAGDITTEEPPELLDMRGGLFCDEPVRLLT